MNFKFTKKIMGIPIFTGILFIGSFGISNINNNNKYVNNSISNTEITSGLADNNKEEITVLSIGGAHSTALTDKGNVFTWGYNAYGQLGDGTIDTKRTSTKITDKFNLNEDEHITQLSMGDYHSSALTNKGNVYTWGLNDHGQLGDGTKENKNTPTKITDKFNLPDGEIITKLNMKSYFSSALTDKGDVFTWGNNKYGQLGDGTKENKNTPTKITDKFQLPTDENITQLSMGGGHSSALTDKGDVFTWGRNNFGQLGDGTSTPVNTPQKITTHFTSLEGQIIQLSMGYYYSSALTNKGDVFTWGNNEYGQLGDDSTDNKDTPTKITKKFILEDDEDEYITQLNMGYYHSTALTSKGHIYTWGYNSHGQLGDDSTENKKTPRNIIKKINLNDDEHITQLSMGDHHSSALTDKGNVYTWGRNGDGRLGREGNEKVPKRIGFPDYIWDPISTNITANSATINFNLSTFLNNDVDTEVIIWNNNENIISKSYTSSGSYSINLHDLDSNKEYNNLSISVDNELAQPIGKFKTPKYTSNYISKYLDIEIENFNKMKGSDTKITFIYLEKSSLSGTGFHKILYKDGDIQQAPTSYNQYASSFKQTYHLHQPIENIEKIDTFYSVDGYALWLDSYSGTRDQILGDLNRTPPELSMGVIIGIVLGSVSGILLLALIIYYFKKNKTKKDKIKEPTETKTKSKEPTETKTKSKEPTETKTKSKEPVKTKTKEPTETKTKSKEPVKTKTKEPTETKTKSKEPVKTKTKIKK